jgi:uracil DNA glycosylase
MIAYEKLEKAWDSYATRLKPLWKEGEIDKIYSVVKNERSKGLEVTPASDKLWRPLIETPLPILRCVIVGDYPYNNKVNNLLVSDGLLLGASNHAEDKNPYMPVELRRWCVAVEKEFCNGLCMDALFDGYVPYYLAKAGVLMWNLSLTTIVNDDTDAHSKVWKLFQNFFFDRIISPARIPVVTLGEKVSEFVKGYITSSLIFELKHPREEGFNLNGELREVQQLVKGTTGYEVDFTNSLPF